MTHAEPCESVADAYARGYRDGIAAAMTPIGGHPYTCAYCRDQGRRGPESEWPDRSGFEAHMNAYHFGLPAEPSDDPTR